MHHKSFPFKKLDLIFAVHGEDRLGGVAFTLTIKAIWGFGLFFGAMLHRCFSYLSEDG